MVPNNYTFQLYIGKKKGEKKKTKSAATYKDRLGKLKNQGVNP